MDLLDDILSEPSVVKAPAGGKFKPKTKPQPKKGPSAPTSSLVAKATKEQPITSVQQNDVVEKKLDDPNSSSFTITEGDGTKETLFSKEDINLENPLTGNSEIDISKSIGGGHLSAETSLGSQSPDDLIDLSAIAADLPVDTATLDASRIENGEEIPVFPDVSFASTSPFRPCSAQTAHDLSIAISNTGDFQIDMEQGAEDSPSLEGVDIMSEAATVSGKRAVKFQPKPKAQSGRKKDPSKVVVVSEVADSHMDLNLPEQGENHGKKKTTDNSLDEENVNGYELHDTSSSPTKAFNESATNTDGNNDGDYVVEDVSKKKKPRKSKKVAPENEKPVRKRRKAAQTPDQSIEKPPKKFPHATRRKRCVDKSLLEAPEDSINFQRLPIRDLIILAEYKERQAKKEAAAMPPPSTNERTENNTLSDDAPYDDDDSQDRDSFDNPSTSGVGLATTYYNYQTFMEKTPRVKWSKQDTELFYQAIRQFGSDLSMVQQLFPGRTRHQIKLKYKKEERQNPMMLHDALTSRAEGVSHFKLVIEKLQEQAALEEAEQNQMSGEDDDVVWPSEDQEEQTLETNPPSPEEAAKSEQNEGSAAGQDLGSPVKSHNSEEDDFDWNEYKPDD